MKSGFCRTHLVFAVALAVLFTGCLFRKSTVSARHFVLAPMTANEPSSAGAEPLAVGVSFVPMPSYLLRDSLAMRTSANEIEYLDGALWGERLNQNFQRTVAANLSRLLSSDNIYFTEWARNQVTLRVFISVQQFDVDTEGRGALIAGWRITPPDSDASLKSGTARLNRAGPSPQDNAKAIPATLSALTGDFSRELAQSLREQAKIGNQLK